MKKIILIGGGSANLFAADLLSQAAEVHIYEKGKTLGRKFLVAGNGGFNLTNSATDDELLSHYTPTLFFQDILNKFDSQATRKWLAELDIPTFVGSSGRVFPKEGIKPIQVLQAIKKRLIERGVQFHFHHEFVGFNDAFQPVVKFDNQEITLQADHYIFALGGASWSVTGSNGNWLSAFEKIGVQTVPFQSSNCGANVDWTTDFIEKQEGTPLKNIQVSVGNFTKKGEAVISKYGLEGNVIYPTIPTIRQFLKEGKTPILYFDLKPNNSIEQLLKKVKNRKVQPKNYGYNFNLNKAELALAKAFSNKETYLDATLFVRFLKQIPVPIQSLRPLKEAISTVGGIDLQEVTANLTLKKHPHLSVIGEMLDWDAPTGGFLLQGCFATAWKATDLEQTFTKL
jgi:uncharacterized flavoprotein (TIGR03862 family)